MATITQTPPELETRCKISRLIWSIDLWASESPTLDASRLRSAWAARRMLDRLPSPATSRPASPEPTGTTSEELAAIVAEELARLDSAGSPLPPTSSAADPVATSAQRLDRRPGGEPAEISGHLGRDLRRCKDHRLLFLFLRKGDPVAKEE